MSQERSLTITLPDPDATAALGARLAAVVTPGDCLLLFGSIGAGKTHLARALIQEWLKQNGRWEEVPSPTFTLVQIYENGRDELWHADLYRLASPQDVVELGLLEALSNAIVLVEWPDRLGDDLPENALELVLEENGAGRRLEAKGPERLLAALTEAT